MTAPQPVYAVILAGGSGTRFWPASTERRPKQFLPLAGPRPLLIDTVERARAVVGPDRILIVAGARLEDATRAALADFPELRYAFEPAPRGTAPALAWAAHLLARDDASAIMVSMHADHRIAPLDGFRDTIASAVDLAVEDHLACISVRPDRAETGYGYVELGEALREGAWRVRRFVEKPDAATAREYVDSGRFLWNTGLFVWRASTLLNEIERVTPEVSGALPHLARSDEGAFFEAVQPVSIDVGVMERAARVATVEAAFEWDDVGVWNALGRTLGQDGRGNTAVGPARFRDARNNIVWTEEARATLIGVSGLVVVEAGGELLVTTREHAPSLGRHMQALERDADA